MNLEDFSRHIESMNHRLQDWRRNREPGGLDPLSMLEQASAALGMTVEEIRVVQEELREQSDRLEESRQEIEAERRRYRDLVDEGSHAAVADEPGQGGYLRDLLDDAGVIVWEAEADTGRHLFISPRAEQLLGYPADAWLSDPAFAASIIHPDDRPVVHSRRQAGLRDGGTCELEYQIIADDGRVAWVRESSRVVPGTAGRPATVRGCLWDISRRKKVERQLYTDRRKLAERLADVSYLYSLEGQLLATIELVPILEEVLAAVASLQGAAMGTIRMFDRARNDLESVVSLGLSPAYLTAYGRVPVGVGACGVSVERGNPMVIEDVESDPAAAAWLDAARLGGYRSCFSVPLRSRDDRIIGAVAIFFREPHRPSCRQVQLVEQYVTRAADAIDNARRHLAVREADRRKDEFLATLAHELRNPLAAIRDWLHLLQPGPDLEQTAIEARDVIARQAGVMTRLVDDLLDAARMRRGSIALRKERVDAVSLAAHAAADLRPLIESRGQQLELSLPDEPAWIEADPTRLGQVLTNLLTNAAKYTDPGGRIDLIATHDREAGAIVIRVRDTGVGLAPEALGQIFELFAQAEPARDRARGGLGIGLALVKSLVELHGGTVSADSPGPGRGSEFVIRLPADGRSLAEGGHRTPASPETATPPEGADEQHLDPWDCRADAA